MKLKREMILLELGDEYMAVPAVAEQGKKRMVRLNETGKDVFSGILQGLEEEEIAQSLMEKYKVDGPVARKAVQKVVEQLRKGGILEE